MFTVATRITQGLRLGTTVSCLVLSGSVVLAKPVVQQHHRQPPLAPAAQWRQMSANEVSAQWDNILSHSLGVAALNQLAIEGFISPACPKTFYINDQYGGFQTLLRVQCPNARGISSAVAYDEMRVLFNRFESNIESFVVERVSEEQPPTIQLPD